MKSNPLSTRFVAPGKLAWRAPADASLAELVKRFTDPLHARAAIVGPHGSGKSTLLENLVPLLGTIALRAAAYEPGFLQPDDRPATKYSAATCSDAGVEHEHDNKCDARRTVWLTLRGTAASRRLLFRTYRTWAKRNCVLVLDGYEQLSRVARGAALLLTRISGAGILVTSHQPTALPTLIQTRVDVPLAQELIDELLPEDLAGRERFLAAERLQELLDKHHGNLREVFMELYDAL